MKQYNIHDAKTNLSKIVSQVQDGETIYLAKAGTIVAEIKAIEPKKKKPFPFGKYKDKIKLAPDWDSEEVNSRIADSFYQEDPMDPNSADESDGHIHPKFRKFPDK